MLWSWSKWRLPYVRRIYLAVYLVAAIAAFALGARIAAAFIAAVAGIIVVGGLEFAYRRRHP